MTVIEPVSAVSLREQLASTPAAYERKTKGPNPTPDPFLLPFRRAPDDARRDLDHACVMDREGNHAGCTGFRERPLWTTATAAIGETCGTA